MDKVWENSKEFTIQIDYLRCGLGFIFGNWIINNQYISEA